MMEIVTDRLRLRPYRASDVDALLSYYGRDDVTRFLIGGPWDREHAESQVRKRSAEITIDGPESALALVVTRDDTVVGDVAAWTVDSTGLRAEIGWVFHPSHGGMGYATEAMTALIGTCFDSLGLHRVFARMDARNIPSVQLAERLGMVREGHLRQDWWSGDGWLDTIVFGLVESDARAARR